jgi:hypothetical protein
LFKSFPKSIVGKDSICPNKPTQIRIEKGVLRWSYPNPASDGDVPKKFVIYAFDTKEQALSNKDDTTRIIEITGQNFYVLSKYDQKKFLVVGALDKNNNEAGNFDAPIENQELILAQFQNDVFLYYNSAESKLCIGFEKQVLGVINIQIKNSIGKIVYEKQHNVVENQIELLDNFLSSGEFTLSTFLDMDNQKTFFKITK